MSKVMQAKVYDFLCDRRGQFYRLIDLAHLGDRQAVKRSLDAQPDRIHSVKIKVLLPGQQSYPYLKEWLFYGVGEKPNESDLIQQYRKLIGFHESPSDQKGFVCSQCGGCEWTVRETRPSREGVRRRKECLECGNRITTKEVLEDEIKGKLERLKLLDRVFAQLKLNLDKAISP